MAAPSPVRRTPGGDGVTQPTAWTERNEKVAPPKSRPRDGYPGRALGLILAVAVGLVAIMFATGNTTPRLGIDLAGGTSVTLKAAAPGRPQRGQPDQHGPGGRDHPAARQRHRRLRGQRADRRAATPSWSTIPKGQTPRRSPTRSARPPSCTSGRCSPRPRRRDRPALDQRHVASAGPRAAPPPRPAPGPGRHGGGLRDAVRDQDRRATPSPATSPTRRRRPAPPADRQGERLRHGHRTAAAAATPSSRRRRTPPSLDQRHRPGGPRHGRSPSWTAPRLRAAHRLPDRPRPRTPSPAPRTPATGYWIKYVLGPVAVPGTDISSAAAGIDTQHAAGWQVNLNFNATGHQASSPPPPAAAGQPAAPAEPVRDRAGRPGQSRTRRQRRRSPAARRRSPAASPRRGHRPRQRPEVRRAAADLRPAGRHQVSPDPRQRPAARRPGRRRIGLSWSSSTRCSTTAASAWWRSPAWSVAAVLTYAIMCCSARRSASRSASPASPAPSWPSASPPTRSSSTSNESATRCATAARCGPRSRAAGPGPAHHPGRRLRVVPRRRGALRLLRSARCRASRSPSGLTTLIDVVVVFLFTKPLITLLARRKFFGDGPQVVRPRPRAPGRAAPAARRPPSRRQPEGGLMSRFGNLGHRLYRGEVSYDFVGRRKLWYAISGVDPARGDPRPRRCAA